MDFQVHELLRIVDRFAVDFDRLPELIPGRNDYRILYAAGLLVPRFFVIGQLAPDAATDTGVTWWTWMKPSAKSP